MHLNLLQHQCIFILPSLANLASFTTILNAHTYSFTDFERCFNRGCVSNHNYLLCKGHMGL